MTEEKKPREIIFHPGCFDNFEGTQKELDELVNRIKEVFVSGELMRDARELTGAERDEALRELGLIAPNTRQ